MYEVTRILLKRERLLVEYTLVVEFLLAIKSTVNKNSCIDTLLSERVLVKEYSCIDIPCLL